MKNRRARRRSNVPVSTVASAKITVDDIDDIYGGG